MPWTKMVATCLAFIILTSCAAPYNSKFYGSTHKELEPGIYRVSMNGNGFSNYETIQTYWLYRIAELALELGYDGIEIMSRIQLTNEPAKNPAVQVAASAPIYIPMYMPAGPPHPALSADVRFLKRPFESVAGRIFDAAALKAALETYVKGDKCSDGNVCPHVHHYLYSPL